ncbi:MAG: AAA domain-containing protein [Actinomycetota bacterium]|nr:AAA domain-containing protein [Actinomycetota bacterium]
MDGRVASERASRVLRALADLSPSSVQRASALTIPTEWFRWLSAKSVDLFIPGPYYEGRPGSVREAVSQFTEPAPDQTIRVAALDRQFGERLAAVDQIRPGQRSIRVGWLFLAGRIDDGESRSRRVFLPLVSVPVRVERPMAFGDARLLPAGDVELTDLVTDLEARTRLESKIELGGGALAGTNDPAIPRALLNRLGSLRRFAQDAADAADLPTRRLIPATQNPDRLMRDDSLSIVAGVGVYAAHETATSSRAGSLRAWADGDLERWTALHSVYVDAPPSRPDHPDADAPVRSPYLLTEAQRSAVVESRTAPVTLISGAPGTGKSHTIAAIACDALARDESVLVAAKADATVDALLQLFERAPGPEPIVFGSSERREALAERLAAGQLAPLPDRAVEQAREAHERAWSGRRSTYDSIADRLRAEALGAAAADTAERARTIAPRLFDATSAGPDIEAEMERELEQLTEPHSGWWRRWRTSRRRRALLDRIGAAPDTSLGDVAEAVTVARALRAARDLEAAGGLEIGSDWDDLRRLDAEAREASARWLAADSRSPDRLSRSTLPAIATLATALRSGRAARRQQLGRLDQRLTHALPLWVGSLPDIDDLLPAVAGLFDVVILDEASSADQPLAAPALLRGRRGVVVGDPQQLRHVSFLSDEQMASAIDMHHLDEDPLLAARLDVRRNSAFDTAAAVAPVLTLDEHFRSDPHLVDFVANRLYGGAVAVATRAPSTQAKACIDVVRLDGSRDDAGVVWSEVDWCVERLRELRRTGRRSVGLVTPFRAQADALEDAVLRSFSADDLEALDVRVGTVHAFQGNERDLVIASLGLGPDVTANSWRFVEDPHLFAVLATRARRRMTVLVSAEPPPGGLVADYLAQADALLEPPAPVGEPGAWVAGIVADLRAGGIAVTPSYPSGRHVIDIATDDADVAIECEVHPGGADRHIERHLELSEAGWTILEAHHSRWANRRGELVIHLLDQLRAHVR